MDTQLETATRGQALHQVKPALTAKVAHCIHDACPDRQQIGQRVHAAEDFKLLGLPTTTAEPRGRGRPKGTKQWVLATWRLTDEVLAELVVNECVRQYLIPRKDDRDASVASVAKAVGRHFRELSVNDQHKVGRALLQFAEQAGVVTPLKAPKRGVNPRVGLTAGALLSLGELFKNLLESKQGRAYGVARKASSRPAPVKAKWDQKIKPRRKDVTSTPQKAQLRIRNTQWAVDPWMRNTVAALLKEMQTPYGDPQHKLFVFDDVTTDDVLRKKENYYARRRLKQKYAQHRAALVQATRQGTEPFYLRTRFDYRGRIHQVGGALTYSGGSDAARAMLVFATPRRVETDQGKQWLARHLINQYSGDESRKVPLGKELVWVEAHAALIADTAADPIRNRGWEAANEKTRFRFIAACRAWHLAGQNQPIALPVAIDASASVLQHMALLLRSRNLATRVNLWPSTKRRDFYAEVGDECGRISLPVRTAEKYRKARLAIPANAKHAEPRSAVKKVAMTRFYGQTFPRAVESLAAADGKITPEHWQRAERIRLAAAALAPEADELYEQLRAVARAATASGDYLRWRTPSGWQCAQSSLRTVPVEHKAYLPDGTSVQYTLRELGAGYSGRNQANGLPANLIQSLDAAHLHIVLAHRLPGVVTSIAVAHDSFGTHADDVQAMRKALPEGLEDMYADSDWLAETWKGWLGKKKRVSVDIPARGKWDDQFLKGIYAFC